MLVIQVWPLLEASIMEIPLHLAQDGTGGYGQFFNGKFGEVYIYDWALNGEQAFGEAAHYSGVQLKKQDGFTYNIPVENSGGVITEENGYFNYDFDGTSQFATLRNSEDLDFRYENDYSISFWVNTTSEDSDPIIMGDQDWSSSGNKGLSIAFRGDDWRVAISDGGRS